MRESYTELRGGWASEASLLVRSPACTRSNAGTTNKREIEAARLHEEEDMERRKARSCNLLQREGELYRAEGWLGERSEPACSLARLCTRVRTTNKNAEGEAAR